MGEKEEEDTWPHWNHEHARHLFAVFLKGFWWAIMDLSYHVNPRGGNTVPITGWPLTQLNLHWGFSIDC